MVVPFIHDLRINLEEAVLDVEVVPPSDDNDVNKARAAVMPCVRALNKDFTNRWRDGSNKLSYTEGSSRQPRGFKSVKVLATASDSRTKHFHWYGITGGPARRRVEARADRSGEYRAADSPR